MTSKFYFLYILFLSSFFNSALALAPSSAQTLTINTLAQDFPPKYFMENNRMKGYSIDIIKALEEVDPLLKFKGQQSFASIPRIESDLKSGKSDAFVGIFKTAEREAKFLFIDIPLHEFAFLMAVRADDTIDIKSLDDIKKLPSNNTILTLLGTKLATYLQEKKGFNVDAGAINFSSNIDKLIKGRGRFLLSTDVSFYNLPNRKEIRILPVVFNREPQYIMLSKKISVEKKERLTKALKKLHESGKLKTIFKHYAHNN